MRWLGVCFDKDGLTRNIIAVSEPMSSNGLKELAWKMGVWYATDEKTVLIRQSFDRREWYWVWVALDEDPS